MPELEYEPSTQGRPVYVEHVDGVTRVVVPMNGFYAPRPWWTWQLGTASMIVVPLWVGGTLLLRWLRGLPPPPRAVFEVTASEVRATFQDRRSGEIERHAWPRAAIAELRPNRFDRGLWVDVPGHVKTTYLADLRRPTVELLATELNAALRDVETPPLATPVTE